LYTNNDGGSNADSKLMERYGHEKVIYMHFPALARNGPPTSFHLTSPKDFDVDKGVAYVILNKFKADKLVSSGMPRPVNPALAAQLMAGVAGCGHPSTWVGEEKEDAWDADEFLAEVAAPTHATKAPKIKLEPKNDSFSGGKLKRALFHHHDTDEDDLKAADSDSDIDFDDDSLNVFDNEPSSSSTSSTSSSAMTLSATPVVAPKGKRTRKNQ